MSALAGLTTADLLRMPPPTDGSKRELDEGEIVVVGNSGWFHEFVKSRILELLIIWNARSASGQVFSESLFSLRPELARIPDVAFVLRDKLIAQPLSSAPIEFVPELAVEVISNSETALQAERKVTQYFLAGVREVWQIYPDERLVRVRKPSSTHDFHPGDTLTSDTLPGFAADITRFFEV